MKIFSGTGNPEFAKRVAQHLEKPLANVNISRFADGEFNIVINENVKKIVLLFNLLDHQLEVLMIIILNYLF